MVNIEPWERGDVTGHLGVGGGNVERGIEETLLFFVILANARNLSVVLFFVFVVQNLHYYFYLNNKPPHGGCVVYTSIITGITMGRCSVLMKRNSPSSSRSLSFRYALLGRAFGSGLACLMIAEAFWRVC